MAPEKFDIDPAVRKAENVIDQIIELIKGKEDISAIKGTLKDVVVTEILRTENLNGEDAVHKLARYLKDDIENFIFNSNKDKDEEIKKDALQYLQNYLLGKNKEGDAENLPDNDPSEEDDNENDFERT